MILYGALFSPPTRKVMVFCREKGVAYEMASAGPARINPEFLEASPFGKIPALRDGDFTVADSTAIVTYIDVLHPLPNLIPTEAKARAKAIWFEEFADTLLFPCAQRMFFNRVVRPRFLKMDGDLAEADKAEAEELPPLLDYIERTVPDAGGYLVEDRFTLADIALVSPLATLRYAGCSGLKRYGRTAAYVDAILARPSFADLIAKEKSILAR